MAPVRNPALITTWSASYKPTAPVPSFMWPFFGYKTTVKPVEAIVPEISTPVHVVAEIAPATQATTTSTTTTTTTSKSTTAVTTTSSQTSTTVTSITNSTEVTAATTAATSRPSQPAQPQIVDFNTFFNGVVSSWTSFISSILSTTGLSRSGTGVALLVVFGIPLATAVLSFMGFGPMGIVVVAWIVPIASALFLPDTTGLPATDALTVGRSLGWLVGRAVGAMLAQ